MLVDVWHVQPLCVGNARVAGMAADVGLVGLKYNVIAAVFFVCDPVFDAQSTL